jgi:hypothetical protein
MCRLIHRKVDSYPAGHETAFEEPEGLLPTFELILRQFNSHNSHIHIQYIYISNIHFNIIPQSTHMHSTWTSLKTCQTTNWYTFSIRATRPTNQHSRSYVEIFASVCLFSNTFSLCSCFRVRDQVSHPYKITGKIIPHKLFILIQLTSRKYRFYS